MTRKTDLRRMPKTTKAGVKKPLRSRVSPNPAMKATNTPDLDKKKSRAAAILGRIGGSMKTKSQTAQRQKSIRLATQIRMQKRAQIAANAA